MTGLTKPADFLGQRWLFLYGVVLCTGLMAIALYFQHVMKLEPCALCLVQRVFVIALGFLMLAGAAHNPGLFWRRVYGVLIVFVAGLGVATAGRHVWLQNLPPDQVPECGPGLEYLLDAFPPGEVLQLVFAGSGECAQVQWTLLGLSIPAWTLVIFCALLLFGLMLAGSRLGLRER